jgi:N-terminal acetyltransferase B complex non-catalytic subunit
VFQEVKELIEKYSRHTALRPIHNRTLSLAAIAATFSSPVEVSSGNTAGCVGEILSYISSQSENMSCFDDIKPFVAKLGVGEMKKLCYEIIPKMAHDASDSFRSKSLNALTYKLQYLILGCPQVSTSLAWLAGDKKQRWKCEICQAEVQILPCCTCLSGIFRGACALYCEVRDNLDEKLKDGQKGEILPELSIVLGTVSIRLSRLHTVDSHQFPMSVSTLDFEKLLQAALILESQLEYSPKNVRVILLLVRLYLIFGCASRAKEVWDILDVKRTISDSLSPLFFDRLSTIAPGMVASVDRPGKSFLEGVKSHYSASLQLRMPRRLADAFEAESYSSIIEIPKYVHQLRTSCTFVMGFVEDARAARAVGAPCETVSDDDILGKNRSHNNFVFSTIVNKCDSGNLRRNALDSNYG